MIHVKREKSKVNRGVRVPSVALLPVLHGKDEDEVLTLAKKELTVIDETQSDYAVYLIETARDGARWWMMKVELPAQGKVFEVVTALGKTKLWKNLDIAVDFIKESCPRTERVAVMFDKRA